MAVKCACPYCRQEIEFEIENVGSVAPCPTCGKEITLTAPAVKPLARAVAVAMPARPVKEYLHKLRENTCYGALRTCINVVILLCILGCLIAGVLLIASEFTMATGAAQSGIGMIFLDGGVTLLFIIVLIAARQAVFVVIDIADALIHEGNKKLEE
jgi:hypothetical protein